MPIPRPRLPSEASAATTCCTGIAAAEQAAETDHSAPMTTGVAAKANPTATMALATSEEVRVAARPIRRKVQQEQQEHSELDGGGDRHHHEQLAQPTGDLVCKRVPEE